ncbi:hypothetical protein MPH_10443 [Macrophomina phaseolina MS6]|uniref:Major facilitator superfamily domain general substrate transporter n=1 Tax=Macrophomina phaseolina (strain MS6) TaxID=1126212 RepID=K2QQY6_MACPH|nr:hypothetical protein MPH_10443 [Macrophomina phaseolina MS6]
MTAYALMIRHGMTKSRPSLPEITKQPKRSSYLDRNALANARVQGIEESLDLRGSQFNTAISVLLTGCLVLQIPSNLILTRVRPSLLSAWMQDASGGSVSLWSCCARLQWAGCSEIHAWLGRSFPGALFLLSGWYTKKELALRTAILYAGALLPGGFGGLMERGYSIALMVPVAWSHGGGSSSSRERARSSWQRFLCSSSPGYPNTTKSLSSLERVIATRRLQGAASQADRERDPWFMDCAWL